MSPNDSFGIGTISYTFKGLFVPLDCTINTIVLLRNHNSNWCHDHNNKVSVLPQLVASSILIRFSGAKANNLGKLDIYE